MVGLSYRPLRARAHAKAPHALGLDELGMHKALPTNQGLHSVLTQRAVTTLLHRGTMLAATSNPR